MIRVLFAAAAAFAAAIPAAEARPTAHATISGIGERIGFEGIPLGLSWPDASTFGAWYSLHNGFGRTAVETSGAARVLTLETRAATADNETYSSLVRTTRTFADVDFTVNVHTGTQLRRPTPNPWEVAWVLWRYTDNQRFYSFIVKPNGWELAKQDVAYRGYQRFLAYTYSTSYPIGRTYRIRIQHVADTITVWVDGTRIVRFTDRERPYRSGSIGLYAEDSSVWYGPVELRSTAR